MFERLSVVSLLFWTVRNSRNHLHICRAQWLSLKCIRLGIVDPQPAESLCCATMAAVFSTSNSMFFATIYPLEQKLWQTGQPDFLKSVHSDIKDGHALNSHLGFLQAISSSKPYILLSRNQATWRLSIDKISGWPKTKQQSWYMSSNILPKSIFPHKQKLDWMLQAKTSSNPYILLSRNLMEGIMQHGDLE